jgi:LysR family transcriptional regulator, glycine cleavage system transcriptional activator
MKAPIYLNALRAFEASARHQSFSGAAEELNVTPAAVGQLVRTLEDWLGTTLFQRANSGKVRLVPTEAAERALPDIRAGFDRLMVGVERLKENSSNGILTITLSPAFAAKWLLPRIDKFHSRWPDMDVRLDTSLKPVDFVAQRIDVGIRYGLGNWPGLVTEKLMEEEVYPVCSPALLNKHGRFNSPADIAHETLIHDLSMDAHTGFPSWQTWLDKAGVLEPAIARGMQINNSAAVLQAAIDGQGIALARGVMAHDDISTGRLIRLFPEIKFTSPLAYYVVYRAECSSLPKLKAFRDWIFDEVN